MIERIINQLIIVAGQWKRFGDKQYEQRFNQLLNELRIETGTTPEGAVKMLLEHLGETEAAA